MTNEVSNRGSELIASPSNLDFSMGANGFFYDGSDWVFNSNALGNMNQQFRGQQVSFFGPGSKNPFFIVEDSSPGLFINAFKRPDVADTIAKYRRIDSSLANRTAYLLGGVIRQLYSAGISDHDILKSVEYTARVAKLGESRSGDAVTSAISLYTISGGTTRNDTDFNGWTYKMSEAIKDDPITPATTYELGISQIARLRGFKSRMLNEDVQEMPDVTKDLQVLAGFPTVGAEFHIPLNDPSRARSFWKRVALLNMSQYHRESYIQLSRTDRGVVEIRMNPSVYPVTIANWEQIKSILPEIQNSFFTATINRSESGADFKWSDPEDEKFLNKLKGLGFLSYAALYENVPPQSSPAEIDFGDIYLGQTVRVKDEGFEFTGLWAPKKGTRGQMAIYAGYGKNLPYLAYYLSSAVVNPAILDASPALKRIGTLEHASALSPYERNGIFANIDREIEDDPRLGSASRAAGQIIANLRT